MGAVLILAEEKKKAQPGVDVSTRANSDSDVELFSRVRHFSLSLPA